MGTAKKNRCNVCDGKDDCVDCKGIPFGTTQIDNCGACEGNDIKLCPANHKSLCLNTDYIVPNAQVCE